MSFRLRALYFSFFVLVLIGLISGVCSGPLYSFCRRPYVSDMYAVNLRNIFISLLENSTHPNGFSKSTAGHGTSDEVFGLFLCRGDVGSETCQQCVSTAVEELFDLCNNSKTVIGWYDACFLCYSDQSDYFVRDQTIFATVCNPLDVIDVEKQKFNQTRGRMLEQIIIQAASDLSGKKFSVQESNFSSSGKLFGLAQCLPDLSSDACEKCLRDAMSHVQSSCDAKQGGRVMLPSCILQFENFHFYNVESPPPFLHFAPPPPPLSSTHVSSKGEASKKEHASADGSCHRCHNCFNHGAVFCCLLFPEKETRVEILFHNTISRLSSYNTQELYTSGHGLNNPKLSNICGVGGEEVSGAESLQYNMNQIKAATNNFSIDRKIGEGGFGSVYMGTLPNGQEIAVKRLHGTSMKLAEELKNEMILLDKLQHRNLVRLMGFCFEGEQKILIYEYVPNKSLDYILFDPEKQHMLDWSRRHKIIGGIARGLLYIHEDSHLRVIHRDLKASNVLLDADMNPKIADFDLARIFEVDQSKENTSRIAGTYGYMAPEYLRDGQFSVKTDVFSFGVLILEIIIGKNSRRFCQSGGEYLLSYAWKNWRYGTPLAVLDPVLADSCPREEVILCIHVALLCVQEDVKLRPTMASVVLMLNSHAVDLPTPHQPAFLLASETHSMPVQPASIDDAPITEAYPR